MDIADLMIEARQEARRAGIAPNFALLGPVRWQDWQEWKARYAGIMIHDAKVPLGKETFYGMEIRPSAIPGVTVQEFIVLFLPGVSGNYAPLP